MELSMLEQLVKEGLLDDMEIKDYSLEIKEIINYLNLKTGRKYTTTNSTANRTINGMLRQGHGIEEFKTIIDNKVSEWTGTTLEKYIRPNTLFSGSHFDQYLNQPKEVEKVINLYELSDDIANLKGEFL